MSKFARLDDGTVGVERGPDGVVLMGVELEFEGGSRSRGALAFEPKEAAELARELADAAAWPTASPIVTRDVVAMVVGRVIQSGPPGLSAVPPAALLGAWAAARQAYDADAVELAGLIAASALIAATGRRELRLGLETLVGMAVTSGAWPPAPASKRERPADG